ncbi:MAG TPA: hypothetical protein PKD54_05345 [Pirellulaceae bacterium]|nr:hypothetical protein [Pirellulaceae bacterium]
MNSAIRCGNFLEGVAVQVAITDGRWLMTHRFEQLARIEEFLVLLRQQQP